MSMDWLYNDLWRAHVSWISPGWVDACEGGRKDFDAVRWLDQLQSAHYKTLIFYTKFHDGHCTFRSRYTDYCTERDLFGECVAEVRKRGMRILAYYSSFLDQNAGGRRPDWQVRGRDGAPAVRWAPQWPDAYCCLNHPQYRDFMLGQIRELCENYKPDGIWMDIFEPITKENCFCRSCQEKYQAENQGGSIFDTHDARWYQSCHADLLGEINTLIKGIHPDCVLGQNTGRRHSDYDKIDDFFTQERFTAPTISLYCRSVRPLGKPFETTSRLYTEVHSWAVRSPERVLLEALATVVHGGASCMEVSPTHTGKIMDEAICRVTEAGGYIRAIEPYLLDASPVYDAGIFQQDMLCGGPWGGTTPLGGWTSVLMERDVPFACLYANADLSPYRLLILDDSVVPDESLAARLAEYVAQGGRLIVECGAAFGNPGREILQKILGIEGKGKTGGAVHYLSGLDNRIAADMGEDDLIVEGEAYRITASTAMPLAFYRYEFAQRAQIDDLYMHLPPQKARSNDPVITLNQYGKGGAMYIACPLTTVEIRNHRNNGVDAREYPTQLAANLARFMVGEPLLRGTTPAGVEVVVNSQDRRHVVHLLSHYISGQYYDNRKSILKLADVPLAVNERRSGEIKQAFRLKNGRLEETPIRRDGQWAEVRIPELGVHELIVLKH
jgi:alpha-L-fucosidase